MSNIRFEITDGVSSYRDPRKDFAETTEQFQVRIDPLTGRSGHLSHFGAVKARRLSFSDYETPEIKRRCPFCPELRGQVTPQFISRVLSEGRLSKGEATLIPNLNPYDEYSGVTIMTHDHVVPLEKMNGERLSDAFSLTVDFLKRIGSVDSAVPYQLMAWNYMPPSGGGIVHPHQQCSATKHPGNLYLDELLASNRFHDTYGRNYWEEYVDEEKRLGQRYIGSVGNSHWLASFVSRGLLGDIVCVFPDVFHLGDFGSDNIAELSAGLKRLFTYYKDNGICSFNASLFFGPADQRFFSCHFRIVPRTFLNMRDFAPDTNFFHLLLDEPVSVVSPEQLCRDSRSYFASV